jgi:hypothetical protein
LVEREVEVGDGAWPEVQKSHTQSTPSSMGKSCCPAHSQILLAPRHCIDLHVKAPVALALDHSFGQIGLLSLAASVPFTRLSTTLWITVLRVKSSGPTAACTNVATCSKSLSHVMLRNFAH